MRLTIASDIMEGDWLEEHSSTVTKVDPCDGYVTFMLKSGEAVTYGENDEVYYE